MKLFRLSASLSLFIQPPPPHPTLFFSLPVNISRALPFYLCLSLSLLLPTPPPPPFCFLDLSVLDSRLLYYVIREIQFVAKHIPHQHTLHFLTQRMIVVKTCNINLHACMRIMHTPTCACTHTHTHIHTHTHACTHTHTHTHTSCTTF